jgi:hypothetical protein
MSDIGGLIRIGVAVYRFSERRGLSEAAHGQWQMAGFLTAQLYKMTFRAGPQN